MAQAQEAEPAGRGRLAAAAPLPDRSAAGIGLAAHHRRGLPERPASASIIYNGANCRLTAETLARLTEDCPNLIGLKDGIGDIERFLAMRSLVGDRLLYINGMPTAEVYARAYKGMGVKTYSSAIFNFVPRTCGVPPRGA